MVIGDKRKFLSIIIALKVEVSFLPFRDESMGFVRACRQRAVWGLFFVQLLLLAFQFIGGTDTLYPRVSSPV